MRVPMHFSEYEYRGIMDACEYLPEQKLWTIPGRFFKGIEPDYPLLFTSKYEAHQYVMKYLCE